MKSCSRRVGRCGFAARKQTSPHVAFLRSSPSGGPSRGGVWALSASQTPELRQSDPAGWAGARPRSSPCPG